jgi:ABC-type lipoprotein release transport system permease subunit
LGTSRDGGSTAVGAMKAAWYWAQADSRRRWRSLVAVGLLVALGTGSTFAFVAGGRRAGSAVARFEDATNVPAAYVFSTSEPSTALQTALHDDPRVAAVQRTDAVVLGPEPSMTGSGAVLTVIGSDDDPAVIGHAMLVAGRYLAPGATDEVLVTEQMAHEFHLEAGQRVTMRGVGCLGSCSPQPAGEATIVGVVRLPPDLTHDPSAAAITLAGPDFLDGRWRGMARVGSMLWLQLRDRQSTTEVINDVSPLVGNGELTNNLLLLEVANRAAHLQRAALFAAAIAMAIACLLVAGQATARHLAARSDDAHTMAAMGLDPRQRRLAALLAIGPALAVGLVGGVVVAMALSPLFPLGGARQADPDVGVHADLVVLGLGVAVAVALLIGVALVVATRWASPSIEEEVEQSSSRVSSVVSALALGPVSATGSRLALERGRGRGRLPIVPTIAALVVSSAVICGALVVRWSIDGLVTNGGRYGQAWTLIVGSNDSDLAALAHTLARDSRVDGVALAALGGALMTTGDRTVHMTALGLSGVDRDPSVTILSGRAPAGGGEVALGSSSLHSLGLHVGDRATMRGGCGEREVTIVGRVAMPLVGTADPDDGTLLPMETFRALCADQLVASVDSNTSILLKVRHEADAAGLSRTLDPEHFLVQRRAVPGAVRAIDDIRQVPLIVAGLVSLLALAAGGHALALSVRRRREDLAVLRALGLRPGQTAAAIRCQALILAAISIVVGIPVGVALGRLLWSSIVSASHLLLRTDVDMGGLVGLVAAIVASALVLSWWPGRRASRLQTARLLRTE